MSQTAAVKVRSFDWEAYGDDVLSNRIPTCRWTRLGVERHYRDMDHGHKRGLMFSDAHAQHALESFLFCSHSKGEWAGQPFVPSPWQQFWLALAFGWLRDTGVRRFIEVWEEVPRKNGKSTKLAAVGLYLFHFDNEGGAEVYTTATKLDQARITHSEAIRMVHNSPHLRRRIAVRRDELHDPTPGRADRFLPLGRDSQGLDGLNPHGGIFDEVHAHPNSSMYDVIKSGIGARRQPMLWSITTAGPSLRSFGYRQHVYATKVLEGHIKDDTFLAIIYTVDNPDRYGDPSEMAKANPNLGVSVYRENLQTAVDTAKRKPDEEANIKTKNFNIWLLGGARWIALSEWRACVKPLSLSDFEGEECYIGIDLAERKDIAALCLVFRRGVRFHVFFRFYHNEEQINHKDNKHLAEYEREGHLISTPGNVTDFDVVKADLLGFRKRFDVREIPYDPKFAAYFAAKCLEDGLPMVEITQTSAHFTSPIIEVENMVLARELEHDGNPVMDWMVSNVVMVKSKFTGLMHPIKEEEEQKIDGVVALLLATGRALMYRKEDGPSFWESQQ